MPIPHIKRKAQTMSERLGFQDPDLSTPEHDAMVFWTKAYLKDYFRREADKECMGCEFKDKLDKAQAHWPEDKSIHSELANKAHSLLGEIKDFCHIRLEHPILNKNRFILGYADIMAVGKRIVVEYSPTGQYGKKLRPGIYLWDRSPVYVEVKPKIYSFGELIRQVRTYQTVTGMNQWYIASPDRRFEQALKDEGIEFIQITDDYKNYL